MEQLFLNENTCDIFVNEVRMEFMNLCKNMKKMWMFKQRDVGIYIVMNKKWKKIEKKLHAQRLFWKLNKNILCWTFYFVNDNKEVDLIVP
jgi:hypothetical protein